MLSDSRILEHAARVSYAAIYIDGTKLGPGLDNWQQSLQDLTPEQRATLEEKIERFEARTKGKVSVWRTPTSMPTAESIAKPKPIPIMKHCEQVFYFSTHCPHKEIPTAV